MSEPWVLPDLTPGTAARVEAAVRKVARERCVYRLSAGVYDRDNRSVCITPTRKLALFGTREPEEIGCGAFACAYEGKERGTVVKFTSDASDVASLRRAGPKYAPRVYAVYRLAPHEATGATRPYVIIAERLLPAKQAHCAAGLAHTLDRAFTRPWEIRATVPQRASGMRWKTYRQRVDAAAVEACKEYANECGPYDLGYCTRFVRDIGIARAGLAKRGIKWTDIALRNVGWSRRDKRWKVLDLGVTGLKAGGVPELQGARQRWRKR